MKNVLSIVNLKGGVGKTTTTLNLGAALAAEGKKVLLIDLDPQGNLGYSLGIQEYRFTIGDVLLGRCSVNDALHEREGMWVIPSDNNLFFRESDFSERNDGEFLLKKLVNEIRHEVDFVLIDSPPTVSMMSINALVASDYVVIPVLAEVLSTQGVEQVLKVINIIRKEMNPGLEVLGILAVNVIERRQLTYEVLEHLRDAYGVNVFNNYVRSSVRVAEAPSHGISVLKYDRLSNAAKDYTIVANELLKIMEVPHEANT